jgi:molybdate/tungstate transport system permease protein
MIRPDPGAVLAVLALLLLHGVVGFLPGQPISLPTNVVLAAANLYVLYCARFVLRSGSSARVGLFATGYFILFTLVLVILDRQSLFILLIVVYASVYNIPYLLGYFAIFVLSFVVLQPYGFESFVPLSLIFAVLWQARKARRGASPFVLLCLGAGLLCLVLVLFPLLHLSVQDSPRTLGYVLERPDVQRAIWTSVATSTVATLVVTLWGVPLAYALARLRFAGKSVVETFVDVPILVPQSVVGVALLTLLGPGSPLGRALSEGLGLQVAGRFAGVVLAQVFVSCPFLIKTAMTAFEGVPPHLESAARTLGASPARTFWSISLPLASRGILVGGILAWARSISEFGSIILFASSPITAPILVHTEFAKAGISESRPIAVLLLVVCLWIFVLLQFGQTLLPSALRRPREERL